MKKIILLSIMGFLSYFTTGCQVSTSGEPVVIGATQAAQTGLTVLSESDLKNHLTGKAWSEIVMDLDKFYATPIATSEKSYKIVMTFVGGNVTAYADCQKLTAKYHIDDKTLTFSNVTYEPALELASCVASEDADQAVYQFMNTAFETTSATSEKIVLTAQTLDAKVTLKR